jgi:hypothetical protein
MGKRNQISKMLIEMWDSVNEKILSERKDFVKAKDIVQ